MTSLSSVFRKRPLQFFGCAVWKTLSATKPLSAPGKNHLLSDCPRPVMRFWHNFRFFSEDICCVAVRKPTHFLQGKAWLFRQSQVVVFRHHLNQNREPDFNLTASKFQDPVSRLDIGSDTLTKLIIFILRMIQLFEVHQSSLYAAKVEARRWTKPRSCIELRGPNREFRVSK